jgi:large subunit ribosomal protein L11
VGGRRRPIRRPAQEPADGCYPWGRYDQTSPVDIVSLSHRKVTLKASHQPSKPRARECRDTAMPPKSKKITAVVRIQQPAGAANVAKVGQVLGAYGINIVQVMKDFNEATEQYRGLDVAADVTIHEDRSTVVVARTPTTSSLIKRALSIEKGSETPGTKIVATVPASVVEEVARQKFPDLNTDDLAGAAKIIAGSARSMGLAVEA